MRKLAVVVTLVSCPLAVQANSGRGAEMLGNLPLRFEANQGQWPATVKYQSRASDRAVILGSDHAAVVFSGGETLRIQPVGGAANAAVSGESQLKSTSNYLVGRSREQWRAGVPHFSRVRYRGVWNGVDMVYRGSGRKLEYDFVVAPEADASQVRLRFAGASGLKIAADGSLEIPVGKEQLRQPLPFAFQENAAGERTQVAARYKLFGRSEVGFELGSYDRSRQLTIDPILVTTYFGGDNADVATSVAVDPNDGSVWISGYTLSGALPLAGIAYQAGRRPNLDAFVAKFNPSLSGESSLQWFTYLGGDGIDQATAMVLSGDGFVYLTGNTASTDFPLAGGSHQGERKGDVDAFLVRLSRTQQGLDALWYSTYFGGSQRDYGTAIAVDSLNRPYIAGYATSGEGFTYAGGSLQNANRGGYDAFFAMFNPGQGTGALQYSTFLGGTKTDVATGIAVQGSNIVWLTGYTMSDDFPATGGAYRGSPAGRGDLFVARCDISRPGLDGLTYATYVGGSDADLAYGLATDTRGRLYITGYTFSDDFPSVGNAVQPTKAGRSDIFLLRFDPARPLPEAMDYTTFLGGSGSELAYGIAVDAAGRVALTGYTDSTDFPGRGSPLQTASAGAIDAFLALIDLSTATPTLAYSSYIGGVSVDVGNSVAAGRNGDFFVTGSTTSRRLGSTGVFQTDLSRLTDGFLSRFNLCENAAACAAPRLAVSACTEGSALSLSKEEAACTTDEKGGFICTRTTCNTKVEE